MYEEKDDDKFPSKIFKVMAWGGIIATVFAIVFSTLVVVGVFQSPTAQKAATAKEVAFDTKVTVCIQVQKLRGGIVNIIETREPPIGYSRYYDGKRAVYSRRKSSAEDIKAASEYRHYLESLLPKYSKCEFK